MGRMFINSIGHYVPHHIVANAYFSRTYGIPEEDIVSRSGILERRKALSRENTNTMALEAVKDALPSLPFPVGEVNLIVGATYSPFDTVGTLAHAVQHQYQIPDTKVLSISSACSSVCNAVEIVDAFFRTGKADKALVVASEHNTAYFNEGDKASGFLWGDGAAAMFITRERFSADDLEILDVNTSGLGSTGQGINGVYLRPRDGGIKMPFGRDVFLFACKYMHLETEQILRKNQMEPGDLAYLVPHQANLRIIDYVRKEMNLREEQVIVNVDKLGNTGCASSLIGLSQHYRSFKKNDVVVITVFGGGYSSGAILMKK
ncbi:MAG TPA: ketoacyl-ACP synthase III [Bacteroidales bacterium]|nr:ketoacyl-ACP synthase III [Bacteroidales bacterium]